MPPVSLSLAEALSVQPQGSPSFGSSPQKRNLNLETALGSLSMEPKKVELNSLALDSPDVFEEISRSGLPSPLGSPLGSPLALSGPASVPYPRMDSPKTSPATRAELNDHLPLDDCANNYKDGAAALLLPKMLRFDTLGEDYADDFCGMMASSPKDEDTPFGQSRSGQCVLFPPGLQPPPNTPSHGSVLHDQGTCRPCAWFHKPGGCKNGKDCGHCHLCPEGEIKARKRTKQTVMRLGLATPKVGDFEEEAESSVMAFGIISPKAQVSRKKGSIWDTKKGSLSEEESTTGVGSEHEMSDGSNHSPECWTAAKMNFPPGLPEDDAGLLPEDLPSEGSKLHGTGNCRPCAWFWKFSGCQNGKECKHCHMCDSGEIQRRRKMKQSMMRMGIASPKTSPKSSPKSQEASSKFALSLSSLI